MSLLRAVNMRQELRGHDEAELASAQQSLQSESIDLEAFRQIVSRLLSLRGKDGALDTLLDRALTEESPQELRKEFIEVLDGLQSLGQF